MTALQRKLFRPEPSKSRMAQIDSRAARHDVRDWGMNGLTADEKDVAGRRINERAERHAISAGALASFPMLNLPPLDRKSTSMPQVQLSIDSAISFLVVSVHCFAEFSATIRTRRYLRIVGWNPSVKKPPGYLRIVCAIPARGRRDSVGEGRREASKPAFMAQF